MIRRALYALAFCASAVLASGGSALAGGWAVATLDTLPSGGFQAGQTYRLGYTIRQHGQTPFAGAKTAIRIRSSADGADHTFAAVPEGAVGHYVAEVRFPAAGEWSWEVIQGPFEPQTLGMISVGPAPAPGGESALPNVAERGQADLTALRIALPLATVLAIGLFAHRLVMVARSSRRRVNHGRPGDSWAGS